MNEDEYRERLFNTHCRIKDARSDIGDILQQFEDDIHSGKVDINKHVGLPGTSESIWNDAAIPFFRVGSFSDSERIFKGMLQVIKESEANKGPIHKGLALYNMGISQFAQKNFDEGIANILAAYQEDKNTYGEENAKKFFAHKFNQDFLVRISEDVDQKYLNKIRKVLISRADLASKSTKDLVEKLDEGEKLFFAKIMNSKVVNKFSENLYTRVVLFNNLRDLCLLLEVFLRRHNRLTNTLGGLIPQVFSKEKWIRVFNNKRGSRDANDYTWYSSVSEFSQKVQDLLTKTFHEDDSEIDFLTKIFLLSVLVRNFTAHNFDEYEGLLVDEHTYENAFSGVMCALLYALGNP